MITLTSRPSEAPTSGPLDATCDIRALAAAARAGDSEALVGFVDACRDDLLRVVRRGLPKSLRRLVDSQDFLQSVWASFFVDGADPMRFESPEQFRAYLRAVTAHKVVDQIRRRIGTRKRCLDREIPLERAGAGEPASSRAETPSGFAIARERMDRLLADQPPHYRRILELRAGGASVAEVAAAVGLNEGSVRRVLGRMLDRVDAEGRAGRGAGDRSPAYRTRPR